MGSVSASSISRPVLEQRALVIGTTEIPYYFGVDCLDEIANRLNDLGGDRFIIVTDDEVFRLYGESLLARLGDRLPVTVLSHEPGESMKTLSCLSDHIEAAVSAGATRNSIVVSFGGGVPGNLAGVLASLLFRGVRLVHIPTTTIAAMDSVLSLKQAINSRLGKNHFGTYYKPAAIFTDSRLFQTLPEKELRSGLCEMAKNCLAIKPDLIAEFESSLTRDSPPTAESLLWLLDASITAKHAVMAADSHEKRSGLVLEYGHTVGHAVELLDHKRRGRSGLSHGECIALGMLVAAHISFQRSWLRDDELSTHYALLSRLGVDLQIPAGIDADAVMEVVRNDNKRGYMKLRQNETPLVVLKSLGLPAMTDDIPLVYVAYSEIENALKSIGI